MSTALSPLNSTIVRSMKWLSTRARLQVGAVVAPERAVAEAVRLFLTPPRRAARDARPRVPRRRRGLRRARRARPPRGLALRRRRSPRGDPEPRLGRARRAVPRLRAGAGERGFPGDRVRPRGPRALRGRQSSLIDFGRGTSARSRTPLEARGTTLAGVVGHSLGAAAIAPFLRASGRRLRAVLVAPPASLVGYSAWFARKLGLGEGLRRALQAAIERRYGVRWDEIELPAGVASLDSPALVIHDEDDADVRIAAGLAVARAWPDARFVRTRAWATTRSCAMPAWRATSSTSSRGRSCSRPRPRAARRRPFPVPRPFSERPELRRQRHEKRRLHGCPQHARRRARALGGRGGRRDARRDLRPPARARPHRPVDLRHRVAVAAVTWDVRLREWLVGQGARTARLALLAAAAILSTAGAGIAGTRAPSLGAAPWAGLLLLGIPLAAALRHRRAWSRPATGGRHAQATGVDNTCAAPGRDLRLAYQRSMSGRGSRASGRLSQRCAAQPSTMSAGRERVARHEGAAGQVRVEERGGLLGRGARGLDARGVALVGRHAHELPEGVAHRGREGGRLPVHPAVDVGATAQVVGPESAAARASRRGSARSRSTPRARSRRPRSPAPGRWGSCAGTRASPRRRRRRRLRCARRRGRARRPSTPPSGR